MSATFNVATAKKAGIVLDSQATQWLNQLDAKKRSAVGQALSDSVSPALITPAESNQLAQMGVFTNFDRNQILLNLNRVTVHHIQDNHSPGFQKQLMAVHDFMTTQYNDPAAIEDVETIKTYFDKTHASYDPSYHIDFYAIGSKVVAANISWGFKLKDGTKVQVSDYNTPIEAGLPQECGAMDPEWLSRQFVRNLSQGSDVVMVESKPKGRAAYLAMGFVADPVPYIPLALGGDPRQLLLASQKSRIIDVHELLNGYVANLGEGGKKPDVQARLQANIKARPHPQLTITHL